MQQNLRARQQPRRRQGSCAGALCAPAGTGRRCRPRQTTATPPVQAALFHDQSHFHSDTIQIAVERGLPALGAWLWFVAAYTIFLFRLVRRARQRSCFASGVVAGVLASFVAFLVAGVLHYNLGEETLVMGLFFFFGQAVAIDRMLHEPGAVDVA